MIDVWYALIVNPAAGIPIPIVDGISFVDASVSLGAVSIAVAK